MQITTKRMTKDELFKIYNERMAFDFPFAEIKPFSLIQELYQEGSYYPFWYLIDGKPVAYTLVVAFPHLKVGILDYFAVYPSYRGHGLGSQILQELKKEIMFLDGILLEVEDPLCAPMEDIKHQEHRIMFYLRSGVQHTFYGCRAEDVPYQLLYMPAKKRQISKDEIKDYMLIYYQRFFAYDMKNIRSSFHEVEWEK